MRMPIWASALVFIFASIASAVPEGPGGTFYFLGPRVTSEGTSQDIWTVNVNSNWDLVDLDGNPIEVGNPGAIKLDTISTVGEGVPITGASTQVNFWPYNGSDMGGEYANASLFLYYQTGGSITSTAAYVRDADGTMTVESSI